MLTILPLVLALLAVDVSCNPSCIEERIEAAERIADSQAQELENLDTDAR